MYDALFKETIIDDLESEIINSTNTIITLNSQGYFIDKNRNIKLMLANALLNVFDNIALLNEKQTDNIEFVYNKFKVL